MVVKVKKKKKKMSLSIAGALEQVNKISKKGDREKRADEIKGEISINDIFENPDEVVDLCRAGKCQLCDKDTVGNCLIMGEGNENADILIVGEAPTDMEDSKAEYYCDDVGKYIKSLFREAGINWEDIYYTKAVKCRSINHKEKTSVHVKSLKACRAFLKQEIRLVNPNVVVLIGNQSLYAATGSKGILTKRGIEFYSEELEAKCIAILDPNSFKYGNTHNELLSKLDMRKVERSSKSRELAEWIPPEVVITETVQDVEDLVKTLLACDEFAFDLETSGLTKEMHSEDGHVLCISFSWGDNVSAVVPIDHPQSGWKDSEWEKIIELMDKLFSSSVKKIAHNGKFDCQWLEQVLQIKAYCDYDTMLAHYAVCELKGTHGLKVLAGTYLNFPDYDLEKKWFKGKDKLNRYYGDVELDELCVYAAYDANATYRLKKILTTEMVKNKTYNLFIDMLMPMSECFTGMEQHGIRIDLHHVEVEAKRIDKKITKIDKKLYTFLEVQRAHRIIVGKADRKINFNSTDQIRIIVYDIMKCPVTTLTDTGKPSAKKEVMEVLARNYPICALLKERTHLKHNQDSFVRGLHKFRVGDRIYPSFWIHGTETGRISCTGPNFQQVPRETSIRKIYLPDEGCQYLEADYSQIELRVIASFSRDVGMLEVYEKGLDLHTAMASKIYKVALEDVTKTQRTKAKTLNFGILYGEGPYSIAATLGISIDEAKKLIRQYFIALPGVKKWISVIHNRVKKQGYIVSPFGRKRYLAAANSDNKYKMFEALRQAVNTPIQGAASDLNVTAFMKIYKLFLSKGLKSRPLGLIHDSISFSIHPDEEEYALNTIKDIMEGLEFDWILTPLKVDLKMGPSWGECKEVIFE